MSETVKAFALSRHRIGIDGKGITSLLTLHGCPLRCEYCLNSQCNDPDCQCVELTAERVVQLCMKDNLYFLSTGGGITVGGGEPLLHPCFIHELREVMLEEWKLNIETSLNVPQANLEMVIDDVELMLVDIKDMNEDIYERYTKKSNALVRQNLKYIAERGLQDRCVIRIPLIPYYNTQSHRVASKRKLAELGFTNFDVFDYILPDSLQE